MVETVEIAQRVDERMAAADIFITVCADDEDSLVDDGGREEVEEEK